MGLKRAAGTACAILFLAASQGKTAEPANIAAPGTIAYKTDFDTQEDRNQWPTADFAQWTTDFNGTGSLRITAPDGEAKRDHMLRRPLDLTPYRGHQLLFRCVVRAKDVSKPPASYLGLKFMVHFESPSEGPTWKNESNVYGTFDRRELQFAVWIPEDAQGGALSLGLQGSTGVAWFDSLSVVVLKAPTRRSGPGTVAGPVFKGHSLPRLRGVMSPRDYDEASLRKLGEEWNANVIRWQLACSGCNTLVRDTAKYGRWLDGKLLELDKVLATCQRTGMLVVVDLHSPPGGVSARNGLEIFEDSTYRKAWVSSWEKIARRYRGNSAVWAYDLVNEPREVDFNYLTEQYRVAKAVRAIDSLVPIMIESGNLDSPAGFKDIDTVPMSRLIYEVHMYYPVQFTHQGVPDIKTWTPTKYPGKIAGIECNKETLRRQLQPTRDFQLKHGVHIYVGEFSAVRWAPGSEQYLKDCVDLFEEYGWDWSYHAYREWDGWNPELGDDPNDHQPVAGGSKRKAQLLDWFKSNKRVVNGNR